MLVNTYCPHQAKESLIAMMEEKIARLREGGEGGGGEGEGGREGVEGEGGRRRSYMRGQCPDSIPCTPYMLQYLTSNLRLLPSPPD